MKSKIMEMILHIVHLRTGLRQGGEEKMIQGYLTFCDIDFLVLVLKIENEFCFDFPEEIVNEIIRSNCTIAEVAEQMAATLLANPKSLSDWKRAKLAAVLDLESVLL